MAKIVVSHPGERVVSEITALVKRPATPSAAQAPHIGLVQIGEIQPTDLIAGPPGAQGPRGSRWYTGDGPPGAIPGVVTGDMYLDNLTDAVWAYDGTAWVDTGTNIHGSPDTGPEILAKLAPVDGAASGLDADFLDGQHGAYYSAWANLTGKPATFPPTVPIPWTDVSGKPATFPPTVPIAWTDVSGKPATFPPAAHTHPESDITNLVADLAAKAPMAALPTFTGVDSATDWDALPATAGWYPQLLGTSNAHHPFAGQYFYCQTLLYTGGSQLLQIAYPYATPASVAAGIWYRGRYNSVWSAWVHVVPDAPSDGVQYVRKNAAWAPVSVPPGTAMSDSPPASPLPGAFWFETDTGNLFLWFDDGTSSQWVQVNIAPPTSALRITERLITVSETYVPPAGIKYLDVEGCGPGGGGGAAITTGAGVYSVGSGGGAGGNGSILIAKADMAASYAVTIGAAGTSTVSGGTSSFGPDLTLAGGGGGANSLASASAYAAGGLGGVASGWTVNGRGQTGGIGEAGFMGNLIKRGRGADTPWGFGGNDALTAATILGGDGSGYGTGGSGGGNPASQGVGKAGGTGGGSFFRIREYF